MRIAQCPSCREQTEIRDMMARKFAIAGPKLKSKHGWTSGIFCDVCGYMAYGHLDGDTFVVDREVRL